MKGMMDRINARTIEDEEVEKLALKKEKNKLLRESNPELNQESLERFLTAQNGRRGGNTLYEQALKEIKAGKLGFECWIRYVYPQLKRSGTSPLTEFYGLKGREEANAKFSLLLQKLIAQGKNDDIQRISVDKEYREQLYEEYGLNELNAI